MKKTKRPPSKTSRYYASRWCLALALAGVVVAVAGISLRHAHPPPPERRSIAPILQEERGVFAGYAGSASCRECHARENEQWSASHHGLAERPLDDALDRAAFEPTRTFQHASQETKVCKRDGRDVVETLGFGGKVEAYPVERVIGHDPLRQFLVAEPGGRLQTLEASFDPRSGEWFDVFANEDRKPGEWGHWTGRGMNWNAMCASCHNTRVRKNYDPGADAFRTAMAEPTVSCESCHGPMRAHVAAPQAPLPKFTRDQMLDTCGSCHARRGELTGDFHPGEKFTDHFALTVVDESDAYFADGQVSGEDYEYGSLLGSKMHAAGVRCVDCHEPHTAKILAPGNALCLRCHSGAAVPGIAKIAPLIDPVAHSHHGAQSAGAQCVSCHMPVTTYMQRHARRDHGFTIPDPLLTAELGIPNACNRCHTDKDAGWSLAAVDEWFGAKMERPSRQRARTVAAARAGKGSARESLHAIARDNASPYWQTAAAHLLAQWAGEPRVGSMLIQQTLHPSPLVRAAAVHALESALPERADARTFAGHLLDDADRSVRIAAAWTLRDSLALDTLAAAELQHSMAHNADQPVGRMQLAAFQLARHDAAGAATELRRAVEWDPNSAPIRHELAVVLSTIGDTAGALRELQEAVRLDPRQAEYRYKLGLAWNETGRTDQTAAELQTAVTLDPTHSRAWYNLGLARNALGDPAGALAALQRGEFAAPGDARIPYARATILARLGRTAEAKSAAQLALTLQPDDASTRAFLQTLGP